MTTFFRKTFVNVTVSCRISSSSKLFSFFAMAESQDIWKNSKMRNFTKYNFLNTP